MTFRFLEHAAILAHRLSNPFALKRISVALLLFTGTAQISHATIDNTVTVTGDYLGETVDDTASEAIDVIDANAVLSVSKVGVLNDDDGIAGQSAGDTISWTITVENTGNVTINSITVTDTLGTPTCTISSNDTIATLAPGASDTCTVSYTLTQSDFDSNGGGDGDIDNTADADGTAEGGIGAVNGNVDAAVAINATSSVTLLKVADDDTLRNAGDVITYTFTITNTGNQTLTNISLGDTHDATGPYTIPDADTGTVTDNGNGGDSSNLTTGDNVYDQLGPGDVLTVTSTYTVTQDDVDTLQ